MVDAINFEKVPASMNIGRESGKRLAELVHEGNPHRGRCGEMHRRRLIGGVLDVNHGPKFFYTGNRHRFLLVRAEVRAVIAADRYTHFQRFSDAFSAVDEQQRRFGITTFASPCA